MKEETLCWSCKNANGNCIWSKNFQPIDGWSATRTVIPSDNEESYIVHRCPNYILDRIVLSAEQISKILNIHIRTFYRLGSKKVLRKLLKLNYNVILTEENEFVLRG